jgi:oligoribonuclease NrnB/cAMP/cGMP phosphodiesterase (DHH superfamily)
MEGFKNVEPYSENYYKNLPLPYFIRLLGRYDLWKHDFDVNVVPFQMGMKSYISMADDKKWKLIFNDENYLKEIIERGKHVIDYLENNDYKLNNSLLPLV